MALSDKSTTRAHGLAVLRDSYLIFWSGVHSVIVLGMLTTGSYYLTLTQVTLVQIVNIFLGIALYWIFYLALGRAEWAIGCGNLVIGLMGTINHYLMRFRGAPFQLSDIKAAETAKNVFQNYNFTPDVLLIAALVDMLLWYLVWRQYLQCRAWRKTVPAVQKVKGRGTPGRIRMRIGGIRRETSRWNGWLIFITVVVLGGCISLPVIRFQEIYANTSQFAEDVYLARLMAEFMGSVQDLPEDYAAEDAELVMERFRGETESLPGVVRNSGELPNIIVIMNEAFSDLRILGELETTVPVLSFWDSIEDNCVRGWANVSVLGGTTANSEYEFLSSDAMGLYANVVPYNKYFHSGEGYPGLISVLREQGYETTAFHPYLANGWNRPQVYRAMGFDHIIFSEDMDEKLDTLRLYASDRADYSFITKYFEEKERGVPQFFFNVTMQNHGGYTYTGDNFETTVQLAGEMQGRFPQAEQYLSCMKASDEALEELFAYFESYEEPVIVVIYGDHQPRLEDGFYEYVTGENTTAWSLEQRMNQYKTPFVIWHNYPVESRDLGDVSVNYLAAIMLEQAGLSMSEYQKYTLTQYERYPVITTLGLKDAEGISYPTGSD
ncbi:MAG: LTA synthase family protein, partial [Acetatifactor sp.]|nr:LTA synthase family protein [Acetatifactor sp.]